MARGGATTVFIKYRFIYKLTALHVIDVLPDFVFLLASCFCTN